MTPAVRAMAWGKLTPIPISFRIAAMPSTSLLVTIAAIIFLSSLLQGAVGFAAGMFGVPLFLLCGVELPQAVALAFISSAVQNALAAWKLRGEAEWQDLHQPILLRCVGQPAGAWGLYLLGTANSSLAGQVVGGILLGIVIVQMLWRIEPRNVVHPAWQWLAFPLSGTLFSFCGMGGPPVVLWVLAHNWPAIRQRAFLFTIFASGIPLQFVLLWWFFGTPILWEMLLGLAFLPLLLVGTFVGLRLGETLPEERVRPLSYIVLGFLGLSALVMPWLR